MREQGQRRDEWGRDPAQIRVDLAARIAQKTGFHGDGATSMPGLYLFSRKETTVPNSHVYEPSVAVILQGRKHVTVGETQFVYDEAQFFLTAVDVPVVSYIAEASEAKPFISLVARLDLAKIRQWILEYGIPAPKVAQMGRAMGTGTTTLELLSAFSRLLDLLDTPEDVPVLSDAVYREIVYRLLKSEQGGRLWHIAMAGSQSNRVQKVIQWLTHHYAEPLRVETLAAMAAMSESSLHHHFRELTSMSPLQFQKQLRLQEARRLMLVDDLDAAMAGMQVGYDSPSQFSREYARMYGQPPMRDIKQLRASTPSLGSEPAATRPAYAIV